jgi:hypothetical protein
MIEASSLLRDSAVQTLEESGDEHDELPLRARPTP